jgi:hypothetical protein
LGLITHTHAKELPMHPLFLLAFATFVIVVGFLAWNQISVKRHRFGEKKTGIGGVNDPLSGATDDLRAPGDMTGSMDEAASRKLQDRPVAPSHADQNAP